MSRNYKFRNPNAVYFVSFATVYWLDVFIREVYLSILSESLTFCRELKGMNVYSYCFMPSHIHLVFQSKLGNPAGLIRDFKKFTSTKIIQAIAENPKESRKEWLLAVFAEAGKLKNNIKHYQLWQHNNNPIELWSTKVIRQKIEYVHNNPVVSGFVTNLEGWKYSSARNFQGDQSVIVIDNVGFMD